MQAADIDFIVSGRMILKINGKSLRRLHVFYPSRLLFHHFLQRLNITHDAAVLQISIQHIRFSTYNS